MKTLFSFLAICSFFLLEGQTSVLLQDKDSKQQIAFAQIQVFSHSGRVLVQEFSDVGGKTKLVVAKDAYPVKIVCSHISYESKTMVCNSLEKFKLIEMKPLSINLNEVVVTGQIVPDSLKNAIEKVEVITQYQIQELGANTLNELLQTQSQIRIEQDNILGSGITMQGLGGENVKILIDGVPVIGRLNGNVDLSQINLDDIERVEIVKGPMSVVYGTDAVAGTINLITKKSGINKWSVGLNTLLETSGKYNINSRFESNGKNNWSISLGRNYFDGWSPWDPMFHFDRQILADQSRFQQWKPKEQLFAKLQYHSKLGENTKLSYRASIFDEQINNKGMPRAPYYDKAFDDIYSTLRADNQLALNSSWSNYSLSIQTAYNYFDRTKNTYNRDLTTLSSELNDLTSQHDTSSFDLIFSRGVIARADSLWKYQLGYEAKKESTLGRRISGRTKSIEDYAVFASVQYQYKSWSLKPAIRLASNSVYNHPIIPAFNAMWKKNNWSVRLSYGKGFRAPSLKQLYFNFVDVNHNIQGNPNLLPEITNNYQVHVNFEKNRNWSLGANGFYNDMDNLITLKQSQGASFEYFNVFKYKTIGGGVHLKANRNRIQGLIDANYTGRSSLIEGQEDLLSFSPDFQTTLSYSMKKSLVKWSLYYKYNGALPGFFEGDDGEILNSLIDPYSLLDASISKRFRKIGLFANFGVRNILDVRNVNVVGPSGAHANSDGTRAQANGRNLFLSLKYQINAK